MNFWIDNDFVRFQIDDLRGIMHKDYLGYEMTVYLAWVADGNTAEEWQPDTTTESVES